MDSSFNVVFFGPTRFGQILLDQTKKLKLKIDSDLTVKSYIFSDFIEPFHFISSNNKLRENEPILSF